MKLYQVTAVRSKAVEAGTERVFLRTDGIWTTDRTDPGLYEGCFAEAKQQVKDRPKRSVIAKDMTVEQWHKSRRANANRKAREQAMLDCGLVRGKTALGRDIWE